MPKGIPFKSEQERKEARKKRYEKIKHTEEYKIKQRQRTKRYYDKNKRKQADRVKEYYAKNKEKILEKRTKNEKYKKYQKEYQKEYQKKYQKELYAKSDDYKKYQRDKLKKWREKNKNKASEYYKIKKYGSLENYEIYNRAKQLEEQNKEVEKINYENYKAIKSLIAKQKIVDKEKYLIKKYGSLENYEISKKTKKQNEKGGRKRNPKVQPVINKQCAQCGKNMFVKHPKHKFCSDKCRNNFINNLRKTDPFQRIRKQERDRKYKRTEKFKELQKKYREKYDKTHKGKINDLWDTLRKRVKFYMQKKDLHSNRKDMEFLVGCSKIFLMEYLEAQFYDHPVNKTKMTWKNKGKWHIDHLTPLAKLDPTNPKHLTASNHFSNLRPMWSEENISKGANVLSGYGVAHLLRKHHRLKDLDLISINDPIEAKKLAKKILKDLS